MSVSATIGTAGIICSTFCWSPLMPHFFLPIDGWLPERPTISSPHEPSQRPERRKPNGEKRKRSTAVKPVESRHLIKIGPYVPPLSLPAWLRGAP